VKASNLANGDWLYALIHSKLPKNKTVTSSKNENTSPNVNIKTVFKGRHIFQPNGKDRDYGG
jgi:hypothetical protein